MISPRPVPVFLDSRPYGIRALEGGACARVSPFTAQLAADPDGLTLLSVIATDDPDGAGDVLVPDGVRNLDEYSKSPAVLWAHNRLTLPPIGTCVRLEVHADRLVAETKFARGVAFAEDLFRLYERGVLRAWSIGFVPRKTTALGAGPNGRRGLRVEEWDLVEYSAAPVPESPAALAAALRQGAVHDRLLREWLRITAEEEAARRREVFADLLPRRGAP
jgi:phage head maturation protease